ncbi:hypothetical protein UlMin_026493 [Ulmus minor]
MSFNPLSVILSQNKLIGENFTDWKRNLNIVLISEKHKFVLLEACPPEPAANAAKAVKDAYEKWIAVKAIMNSRMKLGTPVRDHLLRIMAHFNEAEIHGSSIDQETQMDLNLTALMTELQTFESMIKSKGGEANMVVASSSSSKKKKKVSDKRKASLKAKKKVGKTEKKAAKGGKCFHCGKEGH